MLKLSNYISTGGSNVDLSTVNTNIVPGENNTRSLGTPTNKWKEIYVDDIHMGLNTLYIGDTPILGTEADTVVIKTDPNQHLSLQSSGIGTLQMTSEKEVSLITTGMNADVVVQASGAGAKVRLGSNSPVDITGSLNVSQNVTVSGNLIINGTQTTINSSVVNVSDNIIVVNNGEVGNGVTAGSAGIRVDRGEEIDYLFVFDETDDMFKVGMQHDLETVASQPWVNTNFAVAGHTHGVGGEEIGLATTTTNGLMGYTDKVKLNGIEAGAEVITKNKIENALTGVIWTHSHPTVNGTLNFNNLLLIEDRKGPLVNGGTFTSGAWQTRDINEVVVDNIPNSSVNTNQITLPAGVFYLEIDVPANEVGSHVAMLYDITNDVPLLYGTRTKEVSKISGYVHLLEETIIEIRHRCETTKTDNGFGDGSSDLGLPHNTFTTAKFWWIAAETTFMEPGYIAPGYVE